MRITDFLNSDRIIPDLKGKDKDTILEEMGQLLASHSQSVDPKKVLEMVLAREKVGSTAIGEGVAIPHGRMPGIKQVVAVFARSLQGVDFHAPDGGLTHLFFFLVAPEDSPSDYLECLARISRLLKDAGLRSKLLAGKTKEEIFSAIQEEDGKL